MGYVEISKDLDNFLMEVGRFALKPVDLLKAYEIRSYYSNFYSFNRIGDLLVDDKKFEIMTEN